MNKAIVLSLLLTANADYFAMGHEPEVAMNKPLLKQYIRKIKYPRTIKKRRYRHRTSGADRVHYQR